MSNVHVLRGGEYDAKASAARAQEEGVTQGILIGFDSNGKLFYSGFGECSVERTFFMMEGVKHDVLKKGYEE